jgi:hypothetical protein
MVSLLSGMVWLLYGYEQQGTNQQVSPSSESDDATHW